MVRVTRPEECECHLYTADHPPCGSEECGGDEAIEAFFAGQTPAPKTIVIDHE